MDETGARLCGSVWTIKAQRLQLEAEGKPDVHLFYQTGSRLTGDCEGIVGDVSSFKASSLRASPSPKPHMAKFIREVDIHRWVTASAAGEKYFAHAECSPKMHRVTRAAMPLRLPASLRCETRRVGRGFCGRLSMKVLPMGA